MQYTSPLGKKRPPRSDVAVHIDDVAKKFRLHQGRPTSLKERLLRREVAPTEDFWAVDGVSFDVPKGSTFGVIGHNGSGKSSLLRLIAGIYTPTRGSIAVQGRIAALLELGAGFHPDLTGRENIYLNASILGLTRKEVDERVDRIVEFSGIGAFIDSPVKVYSSGMYVRLGFAVAVNVDPDILLIDEVIAVGDAEFQRKCFDHLHEMRNRGVTIILVTHADSLVRDICEHAAWLDHGELKAVGPSNEVVDAYVDHVNEIGIAPPSEPVPQADEPFRPGNRAIHIDRVSILDGDGEPTRLVLSGEDLTIRVDYTTAEPIDDPVLALSLVRADGAEVSFWRSDLAGESFGRFDGSGSVEYALETIPLLEATYVLSAGFYSTDLETPYDVIDAAQHVAVYNTTAIRSAGLVDLGTGTWRHDRSSANDD